MAIFQTARETLRKSLSRFRHRPFLEATMAASALVATADGEVTFSELSALDRVLESVTDLQIYDPHDAVDIYRGFADEIENDRTVGRTRALEAIEKVAEDREEAELVIRVAVAISRADGEYSRREMETVEEICDVLGLEMPKDR